MPPPGTTYVLEVNPRIPRRLARLEELAEQPLVQLGPSDARAVRAPASAAVGRGRPQPQGVPEARRRAAARSTPPTTRSSSATTTACSPPTTPTTTSRCAANGSEWLRAERSGRLLLRRVRLPREPADLFRRPRHPRRRPLQGGERHAPALRRRRPALPPGLLLPDHRRRRQPARRRTPTPTSTTCRCRRCATRDGREVCASRSTCPAARVIAQGVAGARRPRAAVPARHRPGRERRSTIATSPTGSTAATARRASSRRSCSASAACARSRRWASSRPSGTSTKATPRS